MIGLATNSPLSKIGLAIEGKAEKNQQIAMVAEKILRYLCIHAEAADTVEGIARWWLRRRDYEVTPGLVDEALQQLLREGLAIETSTPSGNEIYRRGNSRGKKDQAEAWKIHALTSQEQPT